MVISTSQVNATGSDPSQATGACQPSHIRTQAFRRKRSDYSLNSQKTLASHVTWYSEGSRARVQRELVQHNCLKCGRLFTVEAYKSGMTSTCRSCRGCAGGKRGQVQTFSRSSRRRLMAWLNALKPEVKPFFLTLTYSDAYLKNLDPLDWKRTLKAFEARFRRAFPEGAYLWKLEVTDRKSGDNIGQLYPHFHLLVFVKGVSLYAFRAWVKRAWYEAVGTGDQKHLRAGTEVSQVRTRQGIRSYASKGMGQTLSAELAKVIQTAAGQSIGRYWGIVCWSNFVNWLSGVTSKLVSDVEACQVFRLFRRLLGHDFRRSLPSLTVSIEARTMQRILAPPAEQTSFRASGRPYSLPFMAWLRLQNKVTSGLYQAWSLTYFKEGAV